MVLDEREGEEEGLAPVADDSHDPFGEKIKYISRSKYHPSQTTGQAQPYAFVVAGEVYVPGYMVKHYELRLGDMLRGTCRVATAGTRCAYRAVTVDQHTSADDVDEEDNSDDGDRGEEDESVASDGGMPTGALRNEDDDASDNSDDMAQLVAQHLFEYVERHGGEVRMAAPPTHPGSLAHYYRFAAEPSYVELIKGWEIPNCKTGVHAFARSFPSLLGIVGRHPKQQIVSRNGRAVSSSAAPSPSPSPPESEAAAPAAAAVEEEVPPEAAGGAPKSPTSSLNVTAREFHPGNSFLLGGGAANGVQNGHTKPPANGHTAPSRTLLTAAPAARPHGANGTVNGTVIVSRAALQASARAAAANAAAAAVPKANPKGNAAPPPARPGRFFGVNTLDAADVKEQMSDLKQDLYIAMMALKAAQEKMHFLEKAINSEAERTYNSSAA